MPQLAYTPTTARSELVKVYKKVMTKLFTGFKFKCPEYSDQDMGKFEVDWSTREILFPLDLNEGGNVASIPEGGWEAEPTSPTLEEGSATWIQMNGRFTLTKIAQYIDEQQGVRPMIKRQFTFQGTKKLDAIAWQYGLYWYGFSTGIIAKVASGTTTITLKDAYGVANLASSGSAYDKAYLARLFKKGERLAILNPTGPALRGTGFVKVTAVDPVNGTITVDTNVTPSANDLIVYSNSIDQTDVTNSTDYNKGVPGLMEVLTAPGLHSLTHDNWSVAYSDTAAGRFSGTKLQRARDEIENWAPEGASLDKLIMDQAVYRDLTAQYMAAVRFDDPAALEIEGVVKTKKTKIWKTRRVPPGLVAGCWSGAQKRMTLWERADAPDSFTEGDKLQDRSAMAFNIDYPWYLVTTARKAFVYWLNQQGA